MKTFRVFTNDRGKKKGVFLYSAFGPMRASTAAEAEALFEKKHGQLPYRGPHGPVKAIEWPPQSEADKAWLIEHT